MTNTTFEDVVNSFHSHPLCKTEFPEGLESQFFDSALGIYELDIDSLDYDDETRTFSKKLHRSVVFTLGLIMYDQYLIRELSRVAKLNGIKGKDISLTGSDATKRVTYSMLISERERVAELLHKLKIHSFA